MNEKIYIAGPDVFEKDSIAIGKHLISLCKKYGYEGLYPMDNVVDFSQSKHKIAEDIYRANAQMIQECDIIIANLNQFRGQEADSGTVWECGFGTGLGKEVYGYMSSTQAYVETFTNKKEEEGTFLDENGMFIEDFDHPINLMIACSTQEIVAGGFEDVLKHMKKTEC